jgi:hypothetical protein
VRYPSYPEYKESGVQWLGKVPGHWEVKRGRFTMRVNPPSSLVRSLDEESELSFVPMEAVSEYGGFYALTKQELRQTLAEGTRNFKMAMLFSQRSRHALRTAKVLWQLVWLIRQAMELQNCMFFEQPKCSITGFSST